MKIDDIRALLEKYQSGACTEAERKIIEEWYEGLQLGEKDPVSGEDPLTEAALDDSLARIRGNIPMAPPPQSVEPAAPTPIIHTLRPTATRQWGPRRWIAAAAIILLCGAAGLYYFTGSRQPAGLALNNGPDADTTVITSRGETRQIVLSDGSTIELNAGSAFRYPKRFTHRARSVQLLKGEAFFQVVSNPAKPFTVTAGSSHTTVLGTSFNIRAFPQDPAIQISLLTGKVNVAEEGSTTAAVLQPHQFIRIPQPAGATSQPAAATSQPAAATGQPAGSTTETGHFDNEDEVAAWREGAMHFKDASFADIAFEIGNKFNVELKNTSHKKRWSYNGLFRSGSLQEAIETICQTENLAYSFTDDGIVISDKLP